MKYIINKQENVEESLVLSYSLSNPEVEAAISFMNSRQKKLIGKDGEEKVVIEPADILYIEKVDDRTFAYTLSRVLEVDASLQKIEAYLVGINFFRCSKSMIVNIDKVEKLKSLPSNRIDCVMQNGEHILISRTYASEFRKILKGGCL